nr:MAG TPA: hypothetical protein [Caudoviricetes sp.]
MGRIGKIILKNIIALIVGKNFLEIFKDAKVALEKLKLFPLQK